MLIGLAGFKRCGKDSVANILVRDYGFVKMGFADALREMALAIDPVVGVTASGIHIYYSEVVANQGYEQAKEWPEVRRFLQRLGTEGVRRTFGEHAWVDALDKRRREAQHPCVVLTDVRFPNEADYVLKRGLLWRINRPGFGGDDSHPSEIHILTLQVHEELRATNLNELACAVHDAASRYGLVIHV